MKPKTRYFIIILTFTLFPIYGQESVNGFDSEGKRHGSWKKKYKNSENLRYQGQFEHGQEVGTFTFYTNDRKNSVAATKEFQGDGTVNVTYFSSNGQVISHGMMRDTLRVGQWTYFHKNSKVPMNVETYKNGQLHGVYKSFYADGQLLEEMNYLNGKLDGPSIMFYQNGQKSGEFNYQNGLMHGEVKYYDAQGNVVREGRYVKDKKVGVWKYYKEGKLIEERNFSPIKNPKYKKKQ